MKQYAAKSVCLSLDLSDSFNVIQLSSIHWAIGKNSQVGGAYETPIYTVPSGRTAKIVGGSLASIWNIDSTSDSTTTTKDVVINTNYEVPSSGDVYMYVPNVPIALKVNSTNLAPIAGIPITSKYTSMESLDVYLNENDSLYVLFTKHNGYIYRGSSSQVVTQNSLIVSVNLSIIEEYEE